MECRREAQQEYNHRTRLRTEINRADCATCGKEMEWITGPHRVYCSTRCKRQADGAIRVIRRRQEVSPERRELIAERNGLAVQGLRRCNTCHDVKPLDAFYRKGAGWQYRCIACSLEHGRLNVREARISSWGSHLRKRFGLSVEGWHAMLIEQSGRCAVCEVPMTEPHVDHDHACCDGFKTCGKCVRGLLCNDCNVRLHAGIDLHWMLQAIAYLDLDRQP